MLRERILEKLKHTEGLDQRTLSQIAQVSEPAISRYLNGFEEIKFDSALRLVKHLYPEQEREVMSEYIPSQKSKNARHALEYCVMTQLWELLEQTVKLLSASKNPVDKEWATMYELILLRKRKLLTPLEQLKEIEVFKPREKELHILKSIFKAYIYGELKEFRIIMLFIHNLDSSIKSIKDKFVKDSFTVRLSLLMSYVCINTNNLEQLRKYCYAIFEQDYFEDVKAPAHVNISLSYMYENYKKSLYHLNKALNLYNTLIQEDKIKQAMLNLSFLKSYWGVHYTFTLPLDDNTTYLNYLYYLIKKGDVLLAKKYIQQVNVAKLSDWDKAFYYYYKGQLTKEISDYLKSIKIFLNLNNHFYLQLPLQEVQKLKGDEVLLSLLHNN